ncbi:MAG: hypothetical protein EXR71_10545 [Myxococcales bacterium]|nr:hypothetical protein [Myxococcales bacterium]
MLVLLLTACASPDQAPAPPSLDEFLHRSWSLFLTEDRAGLGTITESFASTLDEADFPLEGTFTDLTAEEADLVEVEWDADPSLAAGFYLVDLVDCTSAQLEDAITNPDQTQVFPNSYEAYQRDYKTDLPAFLADETDIVIWETHYTVDVFVGIYSTVVQAGAQRFEFNGKESFATDTWAPNPAVTEDATLKLEQDYQIEVYWPGESGGMVHAYAMWRQFQTNDETTQDSDIIRNVIIDNMKNYFENTSTYCQGLGG